MSDSYQIWDLQKLGGPYFLYRAVVPATGRFPLLAINPVITIDHCRGQLFIAAYGRNDDRRRDLFFGNHFDGGSGKPEQHSQWIRTIGCLQFPGVRLCDWLE